MPCTLLYWLRYITTEPTAVCRLNTTFSVRPNTTQYKRVITLPVTAVAVVGGVSAAKPEGGEVVRGVSELTRSSSKSESKTRAAIMIDASEILFLLQLHIRKSTYC